ncbi:MAG: hypothetical protein K5675_04365 [Lachnospiraceae bacterium]|nr:hypothetical protein [Lachnospiraceae bacterium]
MNIIISVLICVTFAVAVRKLKLLSEEGFRKLLHLMLLAILTVWVLNYDSWKEAVGIMLVFIVVVYPVLYFFEKNEKLEGFFAGREKGELKRSLTIMGLMFIIVTYVCEGLYGSKVLALASIYAWGPGDAAAALIGTKFGKHKLYEKKSIEGTLAMFVCAFVFVFILLRLGEGYDFSIIIPATIITAIAATLSELFAKNGYDTLICPITSMVALLTVLTIMGQVQLTW